MLEVTLYIVRPVQTVLLLGARHVTYQQGELFIELIYNG